MAASSRCCRSCTTATRSRSSAAPGRRRRPPGRASSSPARRGRRSVAPRGPLFASNMPGLGREIVERAFERGKKTLSEEKLRASLPRLARSSLEDVLAAVGRGEIFSRRRGEGRLPRLQGRALGGAAASRARRGLVRPQEGRRARLQVPASDRPRTSPTPKSIPIRGINGELPVRFAPNGGAVPGDRIVGILDPGRGSRSILSSPRR